MTYEVETGVDISGNRPNRKFQAFFRVGSQVFLVAPVYEVGDLYDDAEAGALAADIEKVLDKAISRLVEMEAGECSRRRTRWLPID